MMKLLVSALDQTPTVQAALPMQTSRPYASNKVRTVREISLNAKGLDKPD